MTPRRAQIAYAVLLVGVTLFVLAACAFIGAGLALLFAVWLGPYNDEARAATAGAILGGLYGAWVWARALAPAFRG